MTTETLKFSISGKTSVRNVTTKEYDMFVPTGTLHLLPVFLVYFRAMKLSNEHSLPQGVSALRFCNSPQPAADGGGGHGVQLIAGTVQAGVFILVKNRYFFPSHSPLNSANFTIHCDNKIA